MELIQRNKQISALRNMGLFNANLPLKGSPMTSKQLIFHEDARQK